jgi:hypothetical protein
MFASFPKSGIVRRPYIQLLMIKKKKKFKACIKTWLVRFVIHSLHSDHLRRSRYGR